MMDTTHPMVEIIWNFWPFNLITWPYAWFLNILILPIWLLSLPLQTTWNFIPNTITFLAAIPIVFVTAFAFFAFMAILALLFFVLLTL